MKIREIRMVGFKRFTDTTITDLPETARLILLVGPNGCGKSSLIDAVHTWYRQHWSGRQNWDDAYHRKQMPGGTLPWNQLVNVTFYDPQPINDTERRRAVYARSAYRNDPNFSDQHMQRAPAILDEYHVNRMVDNDIAVGPNYRRLVSNALERIFQAAEDALTVGEFKTQAIGEIRDTMERLFPGLILSSLGHPDSEPTFKFNKGDSSGFVYKNLSGGEKAAFDLLLDLFIKRQEFNDTVFFIDEPEGHLAPSVQGLFLDELFRMVPATSQLWLATHSIGMIRAARNLAQAHPGLVTFLDFDQINFDIPQVLQPTSPDRPFWKRAMQIALDDLAGYVTPEKVVLCEGGEIGGGSDFDAACYNEIFKTEFPHVLFLGAGNSHDIQNDPRGVGRLVRALAPDVEVLRVIDRDDLMDAEVQELQDNQVRVLSRRTIESYLLDNSVLEIICNEFEQPQVTAPLLEAKAAALLNSRHRKNPVDDLKSAAGDIYNSAKQLLPQKKLGNDARAFMKGICAPRIRPGTQMYTELRHDIFGP